VQYKHWLVILPVCSPLIVSGCGNNYDPLSFLNSVRNITRTWTVDAELFGKMIRMERDPARLRAGHRNLVAKIDKLVAESGRVKVPSGRPAEDVWNALQIYLRDQQKMVTGDFQELVSIKSDPTSDMDRFRAILSRCKQLEDADLARLHQAEAAFEKAHGILR
jgi:hypothetical protein